MKYRMSLDDSCIEYIFAPFHDHEHSHWLPVRIQAPDGLSVSRETLWDSTVFSWHQAENKIGFTLYISTKFDSINHDQLLVCISLPKKSYVELALLNKKGRVCGKWSRTIAGRGLRQEIIYDINTLVPSFKLLPRKNKFYGVALRITSEPAELRMISLSWLGMRNSSAYAITNKLRSTNKPDWSPWILPIDSWEKIHFDKALFFDETALEKVRDKLADDSWREHYLLLEKNARDYMCRQPEDSFGEYLPNHDARYIRQSQLGHTAYHWEGLVLAFVGLVNEDKAMIQHALRYLMCMLHTRFWTESAEHNQYSSTWNHLSFMAEMTTTSVAILADWLGFALFPRTKKLIRKTLWEKGMTPVIRDLSWREHMHTMNQGAVFNRALVLGGLMLENEWKFFSQHFVDNAYKSMEDVLVHYIKDDGGIHEGIGYLSQTMTAVLWTTIAYCRSRDIDWKKELREKYHNLDRYVAVMSSIKPGKAIAEGDCRTDWFSGDMIPILASIFPESSFSSIIKNCLVEGSVHNLTGTLAKSGGLIGMVYGPDIIKESQSILPVYDYLPQSGKVSLTVNNDQHPRIRLWVSGATLGATHSHRDVSQFVLDIDDDEIFIDRGMVEYWHSEAHFLSRSWLHNVLTPVADDGSYVNQSMPIDADLMFVSPDQRTINVPGNGVWQGYMEEYSRSIFINEFNNISIKDKIKFSKSSRVAFHLHSPFEFQIKNNNAVLVAKTYKIEIQFPWAESVTCTQKLINQSQRPIFHICAISSVRDVHCEFESTIDILRML